MAIANEPQAYDFGEEDGQTLVEPGSNDAIMQWFHSRACTMIDPKTGEVQVDLDTNDPVEGTTAGWHIEYNRWPYIDEICHTTGLPIVRVEQMSGLHNFWQLRGAHFFVLAQGCLSEEDLNRNPKYRIGMAFGWGKRDSGSNRKELKFKALVGELLPAFEQTGQPLRPVEVVVKGTIVKDMLGVLGREGHYRVIRANNERLKKKGTPYWGFSVGTRPGQKVKRESKKLGNGRKAEGASWVSPIISDIPANDVDITYEWTRSRHIGKYLEWVRTHILECVDWSQAESDAIYRGTSDPEGEGTPPIPLEEGMSEADMHEAEAWNNNAPPARPALRTQVAPAPAESAPQQRGLPSAPARMPASVSLEALAAIPGEASREQRNALQKLGRPDLGQKPGLGKELASSYIIALNKKQG